MANQLDQLGVERGQRVLEIGAGSGYSAALLGTLVGAGGHVTTIDVDNDLVTGARAHLAAAGISNVDVLCRDGALGAPVGAPYDGIVVTVGTAEIPAAWLDQAGPTARVVVPLRIAGSATRCGAFERDRNRWRSVDNRLCTVNPLRSSVTSDPRRQVDLTGAAIDAYREQDMHADALQGVLDTPAHTVWSGVEILRSEWLDPVCLWLACGLPNALSRMETETSACESGRVSPLLPWGSPATVDGDSLAYLTMRPAGRELGVVGHGPTGQRLAERVVNEITAWAEHCYAAVTVEFVPHGEDEGDHDLPATPGEGRYVITRPSGRLTIAFE